MFADVILTVIGFLLLVRGRDRLETRYSFWIEKTRPYLLLARRRDRLETVAPLILLLLPLHISYSLGDAIDWKHQLNHEPLLLLDDLLLARGRDRLEISRYLAYPVRFADVSYSLGDAIDWIPLIDGIIVNLLIAPLLARGCDRLETL